VSDQRFVPSAVHCPACAAADAAIADGSDGLAIQLAIARDRPKVARWLTANGLDPHRISTTGMWSDGRTVIHAEQLIRPGEPMPPDAVLEHNQPPRRRTETPVTVPWAGFEVDAAAHEALVREIACATARPVEDWANAAARLGAAFPQLSDRAARLAARSGITASEAADIVGDVEGIPAPAGWAARP
jgi:hypothetical protein